MFAEDFLSISLAELLGLLVTIGGVWFVVQQLREAKLASQMEGLMELIEQWTASAEMRKPLSDLSNSIEWNEMSDKEAYNRINESQRLKTGWDFMMNWYELIGVLVRKKALNREIVYELIGPFVAYRWKKYEKVIRHYGVERDWHPIHNWEWLAIEFEKMSK
jgi:hypothetical protein